jgi:hypothetical protein
MAEHAQILPGPRFADSESGFCGPAARLRHSAAPRADFAGSPADRTGCAVSSLISPAAPGIAGGWETSENNRRAKFYELTAAGRKSLRQEQDGWNRLVATIASAPKEHPEEET